MPFGLLVPVVVVGWGTVCALTRWQRLGKAARVPALVTNELPFLASYLLIGSTALALVQGDLDSIGELHSQDQFWQKIVTVEVSPALLVGVGELEDYGER